MKKITALFSVVLLCGFMVGCAPKEDGGDTGTDTPTVPAVDVEEGEEGHEHAEGEEGHEHAEGEEAAPAGEEAAPAGEEAAPEAGSTN